MYGELFLKSLWSKEEGILREGGRACGNPLELRCVGGGIEKMLYSGRFKEF